MKPLGLALVLVILVSSFVPAPTYAADCQFVLGFRTLRDLIPDIVGDCKVSQQYNPQNGDALQETTRGLLVWRKADNFTAFTDGHRSWVNGPNGLQRRLNTERFDWEAKEPVSEKSPARRCFLTDADVRFEKFVPSYDGSTWGSGTIRNPCDQPINVIVDVYANASKDGPTVMDAPSIFVLDLAPRASKPLTVRIPYSAFAGWFTWYWDLVDDEPSCYGPRQATCLSFDRWLTSALRSLTRSKDGAWLVKVAAENGVRIVRSETDIGVLGRYNRPRKTITIDSRLDAYSSWVRAAVLAHELQHAESDAAGRWPESASGCYRAEEEAFRREANIWAELWGNQMPPNVDSVHEELNDISFTTARDPVGFAMSLIRRYGRQCQD